MVTAIGDLVGPVWQSPLGMVIQQKSFNPRKVNRGGVQGRADFPFPVSGIIDFELLCRPIQGESFFQAPGPQDGPNFSSERTGESAFSIRLMNIHVTLSFGTQTGLGLHLFQS